MIRDGSGQLAGAGAACSAAVVLLLTMVLAAPPVAACQPSGPVGPPQVAIWTLATNETRAVDVGDAGGLTGACGYSLEHDLEGDRFVWRGDDGAVHALDLDSGERERVPLEPGRHGMLSLFDDRLLYYHYAESPESASVRVYNFTTGEDVLLREPSQLDLSSGTTTAGPLVIHISVDAASASDRLSIYDARAREWRVHNASLAELGLHPGARVTEAGEEWIVFDHRAVEWWAFHVPTLASHNLTNVSASVGHRQGAIEGDWLYHPEAAFKPSLIRTRLPDGGAEVLGRLPPMEFLGTVDDGRVVLGDLPLYESWIDMVRERYLAAPGALVVAAAALAAVALRRRR